jgi:hypothetical protein
MTDTLDKINEWHRRACPRPDEKAFNVQAGCHFEEVAEMIGTFMMDDPDGEAVRRQAYHAMVSLSHMLKRSQTKISPDSLHRVDFLDACADQVVTAMGTAYRAKMNGPLAVQLVDLSNWTKYGPDMQPFFDPHGKVMKGPGYKAPDLSKLV